VSKASALEAMGLVRAGALGHLWKTRGTDGAAELTTILALERWARAWAFV
jgi:hypothetical protein